MVHCCVRLIFPHHAAKFILNLRSLPGQNWILDAFASIPDELKALVFIRQELSPLNHEYDSGGA